MQMVTGTPKASHLWLQECWNSIQGLTSTVWSVQLNFSSSFDLSQGISEDHCQDGRWRGKKRKIWASLSRTIHKRSFCHFWGMLDDEHIGSALFPGVPCHIGSWEPFLFPGRLIIVDQRRGSSWRGGGREEVSLIESERRTDVKGGRPESSTTTDLTRGHSLLGAGCQATPGDLWEEMSYSGPFTTSTWGPLQGLLGLVLVKGRIPGSMGGLSWPWTLESWVQSWLCPAAIVWSGVTLPLHRPTYQMEKIILAFLTSWAVVKIKLGSGKESPRKAMKPSVDHDYRYCQLWEFILYVL